MRGVRKGLLMADPAHMRFHNIQALRGVAVLAVVLFHLASVELKYGGGGTLLPNWMDFGQFGVDLFFVISGFVMMVVTHDRTNRSAATVFLVHRITRIYPLYWFYSILLLMVYFVHPAWVTGSQDRSIDITASFLLLPQEGYPLLSVGWTLVHEMYFYLVFFAIVWLTPVGRRMYAVAVWLLCVLAAYFGLGVDTPVMRVIASPLTTEFMMGCLIARYALSARVSGAKNPWLIPALALIISVPAYLYYRDVTGSVGPAGWWRILLFGMPAALVVWWAVHAERSGVLFTTLLRRIGDASYSTYLTHILTLALLGKLWARFSGPGLLDNLIMLPTLLLIALMVGAYSYRYVERPMLEACRRWM
ncbi:MAG: acyltransferase [Sideroxydans sp.]|nr:acyltransferase [Sideroxydans sp.]